MTMIYSNPVRENEAGALPDVEVRVHAHVSAPIADANCNVVFGAQPCRGEGWYWQTGVFDTSPTAGYTIWRTDGEPHGPFDTEAEAIADAQSDAARDSASPVFALVSVETRQALKQLWARCDKERAS